MSDSQQSSYEALGLSEGASFEEIQDARDRLLEACGDDPKRKEAIEIAYDAILMERLRLRQEGKIKVPDRIRFAENLPDPPAASQGESNLSRPSWLTDLLDTPERDDILWPAVIFLGLALFSFVAPSLSLALGVATAIYFLNRKERKFWRSTLLTFGGLLVGVLLGLAVSQLLLSTGLGPLLANAADAQSALAAALTCAVLWAVASFLR